MRMTKFIFFSQYHFKIPSQSNELKTYAEENFWKEVCEIIISGR